MDFEYDAYCLGYYKVTDKKIRCSFCNISSCPLGYYYFWGLWLVLNSPSKKDFQKISENSLSEKYFDFVSGFLVGRLKLNKNTTV